MATALSVSASTTPRAHLCAAGLTPKRSWGQNFLTCQATLADIAAVAVPHHGMAVVELGAGLGALTAALLAAGARVLAVERDRDLIPLLRGRLALADGLEVLEADAARLDYAALAARLGGPVHVVGNLPYQLSGRILGALGDSPDVACATLLVQREVAERLVAPPGSRTYGLLSVLVQRRFAATLLQQVPPGAFYPAPKVDSTVVHLRARAAADTPATPVCTAADAALVAAARAAFAGRRKTLRNALACAMGRPGAEVAALLDGAGVAPGARAETLDVAAFGRMGAALAAAGWL